ncbi:peptide chain release factor N(5)-glutamine methyltransferase [Polycladidibacter hongkongensis]|uniref:peptide chain release factor N(5)-glutamine methyltransferase n=1 Tax=Polycladidibacter hongkongensis TaxID=1647556 RepID=UPI000A5F8FE1|nr:peptide chain release factor N(5)-glutamine methyltransferase [Pseudovibrio hongkongensis]
MGLRLEQLLIETRCLLKDAGISEAALDARILVSEASGIAAASLPLEFDRVLSPDVAEQVRLWAGQRVAGKPVHRIIGWREFWGLRFTLGPDTLEPRPDTETLVEVALRWVDAQGLREAPLKLADIGTGSGAIAVAMLSELPNAQCVAVDLSAGALTTARKNAEANGVGARFLPVQADYVSALSGGFDMVLSNPPYIRSRVVAELSEEVRTHDPMLALDGGDDGLTPYPVLLQNASHLLRKGGAMMLEIGFDQAADVLDIAKKNNAIFARCHQDLAGQDRVIEALFR